MGRASGLAGLQGLAAWGQAPERASGVAAAEQPEKGPLEKGPLEKGPLEKGPLETGRLEKGALEPEERPAGELPPAPQSRRGAAPTGSAAG